MTTTESALLEAHIQDQETDIQQTQLNYFGTSQRVLSLDFQK